MSSTAKVLPVGDCDSVDTQVGANTESLQFCQFETKTGKSPVASIERALTYAKGPEKYLRKSLGDEVFEARRPNLCIPEAIDKDVYGTGAHKQHFEQHIANLLGKKHGLFFLTGVQAQLAALKVHSEQLRCNRVAWHVTSHLESAEERAWDHLYNLDRALLGNDPLKNPSVEEIQGAVSQPEAERPGAIVLEIPNRSLGCKTYSFDELQQISQICRKANVRLHCDGARLWEIEPYYKATSNKSFADIGELFDSVYVSFYKGLGGVTGAMLATNDIGVHAKAKQWQRRAGGNPCTFVYELIDDERGFNQNIGEFHGRWHKMQEIVEGITAATEKFRTKDGEPFVSFNPAQPTCCQIHTVFQGFTAEELLAARDKVERRSHVRVFEKLRPKQTLDEQSKEKREEEEGAIPNVKDEEPSVDLKHFLEWLIMPDTEKIETEIFVGGYVALCEELAISRAT